MRVRTLWMQKLLLPDRLKTLVQRQPFQNLEPLFCVPHVGDVKIPAPAYSSRVNLVSKNSEMQFHERTVLSAEVEVSWSIS